MHISRTRFLFWGSAGTYFHDLLFKTSLFNLYWLYFLLPPQFSFFQKQLLSFKGPISMSPLCSDWPVSGICLSADFSPLPTVRYLNIQFVIRLSFFCAIFLAVYSKCKTSHILIHPFIVFSLKCASGQHEEPKETTPAVCGHARLI